MGQFHPNRFPGETEDYRKMRDRLLELEINLRKQIEAVAALRRELPRGGKIKEDYVFDEGAADLSDRNALKQTRLSELFDAGKNTLAIYSFMFAPDWEKPCPSCTSILDGLNGSAPHIYDKVNFAVVAKAPIGRIREWGRERGWNNLRLLSSSHNTYNRDYCAESDERGQMPAINVFRKENDQIHHFYNSELLYAPTEPGQDPRHVDLIWPIWNLFDLTPEGRGTDWRPKLSYQKGGR
ncbi:MAG: DUF899 family protein [Deltaproteobacteria bacterium]